jgi:putative tryptophan/tyrosine transport system substrate-binding protein
MPVVGFLRNTNAASSAQFVSAFRRGLAENGYIEGQNVVIEYRWADDHDHRLPELAAEFVNQHVAVIVAGGGSVVALATKTATQTIPIVVELWWRSGQDGNRFKPQPTSRQHYWCRAFL